MNDDTSPAKSEQNNVTNKILASIQNIELALNASNAKQPVQHYKALLIQLSKGMAFGLGSVLGASVIVSITVFILSQVEFIPIIGEWVKAIIDEIQN